MKTEPALRQELQSLADASSQTELAARLGVSQSLLSLILLGKRSISRAVAAQLGYTRVVEKSVRFVRADER